MTEKIVEVVALKKAFSIGFVRVGFTNAEVRLWYNNQLKSLNTSVAFTEGNARALHAARNALKVHARALMADREAAALLEETDPIKSFEYYVEKYSSQGYSGARLWQKIIEGSSKPKRWNKFKIWN